MILTVTDSRLSNQVSLNLFSLLIPCRNLSYTVYLIPSSNHSVTRLNLYLRRRTTSREKFYLMLVFRRCQMTRICTSLNREEVLPTNHVHKFDDGYSDCRVVYLLCDVLLCTQFFLSIYGTTIKHTDKFEKRVCSTE